MSVNVMTAPRATAPARPQAKARSGLLTGALIGLFGLALPVMRYVEFGGGKVNACAADALLLPVLLLSGRRWLRSGALGSWIFALWMVNVIAWNLSLSVLTFDVFLRECMKVAICYLYALAGFGLGSDRSSEQSLTQGLVWSALPMAAVGIFAFFVRQPSFFIVESRVAGTLGDANAFGIYLGMMLPLVGSLNLAWLLIPLLIAAGVVTFSRTGMIAIGASLLLSGLHLKFRRYLLVMVACLFVVVSVWGVASNTRVGKRIANYHGSLEERQSLWSRAAGVAVRHPVFGIGKGNWEAVSRSHTLPHNTFLSVMTDGGVIGFTVFMIPLAMWLWRGMKRPSCRRWAIAVFVGLVGGMAVSLDNFRPFWLVVGLLVAGLTATEREDARERVRWQ